MNYVPNQNGKVLEETQAGFNSDDGKTTLRRLRGFKMTLPRLQLFTNLAPFLCHFVTHNKFPLPSGPSLILLHPIN